MEKNKKQKKSFSESIKDQFGSRQFRNGGFSLAVIAVVLAIIVVINLIAGQLPESVMTKDISESGIYSIGDTAKEVINGLDHKVKITVISETGKTDSRIETFLSKYADLSSDLTLEYTDPVLHPDVLTEYGVNTDNVVVSCEDTGKHVIIPFDDILIYDQQSYYYYGTKNYTAFDGEGQLTSAVASVTADNSKNIYTLSGHGESAFGSSLTDLLDKASLSTASLNLLDKDMPEDCDLLIINNPVSDLAEDEYTVIHNYLYNGGNVMLVRSVTDKDLPRFDKLMSEYGLTMVNSYIGDMGNYYQRAQSPFYFFPTITVSDVNVSSGSTILVGPSAGILTDNASQDNLTVTNLLTTTSKGFKEGNSDNAQKYVIAAQSILKSQEEIEEESQTEGESAAESETQTEAETEEAEKETVSDMLSDASLSGSAEELVSEPQAESKMIVLAAASMIDASLTDNFSGLENNNEFVNMISSYFDDIQNISIPSKSLSVEYNTVTTANLWNGLFVVVIPAGCLIGGFIIWFRRRKA